MIIGYDAAVFNVICREEGHVFVQVAPRLDIPSEGPYAKLFCSTCGIILHELDQHQIKAKENK